MPPSQRCTQEARPPGPLRARGRRSGHRARRCSARPRTYCAPSGRSLGQRRHGPVYADRARKVCSPDGGRQRPPASLHLACIPVTGLPRRRAHCVSAGLPRRVLMAAPSLMPLGQPPRTPRPMVRTRRTCGRAPRMGPLQAVIPTSACRLAGDAVQAGSSRSPSHRCSIDYRRRALEARPRHRTGQ
jgi:hypothetical protein